MNYQAKVYNLHPNHTGVQYSQWQVIEIADQKFSLNCTTGAVSEFREIKEEEIISIAEADGVTFLLLKGEINYRVAIPKHFNDEYGEVFVIWSVGGELHCHPTGTAPYLS